VRDVVIGLPYTINDIYDVVSGISGDLSLAWPHSPGDLIDIDSGTGTTHPSPLLERYALDLQNWALHPVVISIYPLLAGSVRVVDT
jgi:hypothetical protein